MTSDDEEAVDVIYRLDSQSHFISVYTSCLWVGLGEDFLNAEAHM